MKQALLATAILGAALGAAAISGCAPRHRIPEDFGIRITVAEETAPLGGSALIQRRHQMERAHRDLIHFQTTLESLHYHHDRLGVASLSRFIDAYMGLHLDGLLKHEWQSRHPEVMALDVNLRLIQASVWIRMNSNSRADHVMDDIERRFAGRESMLVEYPIGTQHTLGESLEILREAKWQRYM